MPLQSAAGVLLIANRQKSISQNFCFRPGCTVLRHGLDALVHIFVGCINPKPAAAALTTKWAEQRSRKPRPTWPVCSTESDGIPSMSCHVNFSLLPDKATVLTGC